MTLELNATDLVLGQFLLNCHLNGPNNQHADTIRAL